MKRIRLSYPVTRDTPLYPGTPAISCQPVKSLHQGDSSNTSLISFSSHTGTHIDVPRHFCPDGKTARDVLKVTTEISPVFCLNISTKPQEAIRIADLKPHLESVPDAAGLLIRTGMFRMRASDPARYITHHPWVHPEVPDYLRTICPSLLLFGTDTISISNPDFRSEGKECHRAFLCGEKPILLAEDLDLSDPDLMIGRMRLEIYPWIIDDLDGVPVQVFADTIPIGCPNQNIERRPP